MEPSEISLTFNNIQGFGGLDINLFPGNTFSNVTTVLANYLNLSPSQIDLAILEPGPTLSVIPRNSQFQNINKIGSAYLYFIKPLPKLNVPLNVPPEIFEQMILKMTFSDVASLCSSSKEMRDRCGDQVWKLLYHRDF